MAKSLVIVESPAKAKTINKYLGSNFIVKASVGHIKDLPQRKLGVNIEENFTPEYVTIRGKGKVIQELKTAAKKVDSIYLAPDPDREGEAICWHIAEELKKSKNVTQNIYRVMFNEITKKAVSDAIKHPSQIDIHKVDAQQTRRILDRLVGYKISPLLWKKVQKGLSAGRVQSVALRIICDREHEIKAFTSEEYWSITAQLEGANPPPFAAKLIKIHQKKAKVTNADQATAITGELRQLTFTVAKVSKKESRRRPVAPFTTSTLQQEAARKLRFSAKKTMTLAQKLYEGVDLGKEGPVGLITYMRTDSTRISEEALAETRSYIVEHFGDAFLPAKPNTYKTQKSAQEAHEAIRPTSVYRTPEAVKPHLSFDEFRLYTLIWKRLMASQMKPAVLDVTTIDVAAGDYLFRATGSVIKFPGFMKLYIEGTDAASDQEEAEAEKKGKEKDNDLLLPLVEEGEVLHLLDLIPKQHFTQPPPRYTEATLVKELEKKGIGRPSTYASIISTILDRQYAVREERKLVPSDLGLLITELLVENFPKILDVDFTANFEEKLDKIEEGSLDWVDSLRDFYQPFTQELERAAKEMRNVKKEREELTDEKCEKCGEPMMIKYGRYGKFLACTGFPKCRNTRPLESDTPGDSSAQADGAAGSDIQETCEKCGKPMVLKRGRYGTFLACSGYPECKNTKKIVQGQHGEKAVKSVIETDQICEKCGAKLVIREGRYGQFYSCSNYPKCKFIKPMGTGVKCPEEGCDGELVQRRARNKRIFYSCSNYPTCKYSLWFKPVPRPCPQCQAPFLVEKWDKETEQTFVACLNEQCGYTEQ